MPYNENAAADQHKRSPEDLKAETSRRRLSGEPLVQVPSPPRSSQGAERAVAPREGSVKSAKEHHHGPTAGAEECNTADQDTASPEGKQHPQGERNQETAGEAD